MKLPIRSQNLAIWSEMSIAVSNCCISSREKNGKSADWVAEYLSTLWNAASQFQISYRRKCKQPAWTKNEICVAVSRETRSRNRVPLRNLWRHSPKFRYRYSCRFADGKYARRDHVCVCVCVIWMCVHLSFLIAPPCTLNFNSLSIFRFSTFLHSFFVFFFAFSPIFFTLMSYFLFPVRVVENNSRRTNTRI